MLKVHDLKLSQLGVMGWDKLICVAIGGVARHEHDPRVQGHVLFWQHGGALERARRRYGECSASES